MMGYANGQAFVHKKESFCGSGDMARKLDVEIKGVNVQKAQCFGVLWVDLSRY